MKAFTLCKPCAVFGDGAAARTAGKCVMPSGSAYLTKLSQERVAGFVREVQHLAIHCIDSGRAGLYIHFRPHRVKMLDAWDANGVWIGTAKGRTEASLATIYGIDRKLASI